MTGRVVGKGYQKNELAAMRARKVSVIQRGAKQRNICADAGPNAMTRAHLKLRRNGGVYRNKHVHIRQPVYRSTLHFPGQLRQVPGQSPPSGCLIRLTAPLDEYPLVRKIPRPDRVPKSERRMPQAPIPL